METNVIASVTVTVPCGVMAGQDRTIIGWWNESMWLVLHYGGVRVMQVQPAGRGGHCVVPDRVGAGTGGAHHRQMGGVGWGGVSATLPLHYPVS